MVGGYSLRVIKSTILGFDEMPACLDEYGDLIADGLNLIAVGIIYNIPLYIVSAIFIISALGKFDLSFASSSSQITIAMVAFFISIVFIPAGGNMAYEEKFKAAFDIKRIFDFYKKILDGLDTFHICYL
jgi:hypothetical protein